MDNAHYKLLVIDDEIGVRQSLTAYLGDSGFQVYDAADAATGFALFQQHLPDLVITDLSMPDTDGLALLQQIHEVLPSAPVIVISGAGVMGDVVHALRLGATDYLIKPIVDMEVLVLAIHRSLERCQLLVDNERYRLESEKANTQLRRHVAALEQDQRAGNFVQRSMSPVSPFTAGQYICEHDLIPSLYLSGDCVDYAFIKQRYYAFYLADVSGHGSAPAFVTIWLRNVVAQLVRLKQMLVNSDSLGDGLLNLLHVINKQLIEMGINNHLTIIIGVLDTETEQLYYVVAGHLPLPVLLHENKAVFLPGSGKPVGLFEKAKWEVSQVSLPEGKYSLLLFSDGILELIEEKELIAKEDTLLKIVEESYGHVDSIVNSVGVKDIEELPDDVAILSIRRIV
jgi:serine phosphatase RsbU (regulator of sigma subunit)